MPLIGSQHILLPRQIFNFNNDVANCVNMSQLYNFQLKMRKNASIVFNRYFCYNTTIKRKDGALHGK